LQSEKLDVRRYDSGFQAETLKFPVTDHPTNYVPAFLRN
jgi:hypothetical protein